MRYGIGSDLENTGGLNPIVGGYLEKYRELPIKKGKLTEKEERERNFKRNAVQQSNLFGSYVSDFLKQRSF